MKEQTAGLSIKGRPDPISTNIRPGTTSPTYASSPPRDDQRPNTEIRMREVGGPTHVDSGNLPDDVKKGFIKVQGNLRSGTYIEPGEGVSRGAACPWKPKGRA